MIPETCFMKTSSLNEQYSQSVLYKILLNNTYLILIILTSMCNIETESKMYRWPFCHTFLKEHLIHWDLEGPVL